MQITNQPIIITGAASGLGAETAAHLAKAGAKLALWDINYEAASAQAKALGAVACKVDVTDEQSVQAALGATTRAIGIPRALVQCAGILVGAKLIDKEGAPADLAHFTRGVGVNLSGTFNVMRLVAASMAKADPQGDDAERGVIINTASVAAYEGQIGQVAYSASKGGVVAMTLPAARELAAHGIRVMSIAPGIVHTPMIASLPDKIQDALKSMIPFPRRLTQPREFAALCQHIIENPMLNGSTIRLDGAVRLAAK